MKRIMGLFLALMLFAQPLCAMAEAAPPPPPPPQAPSAPVISPEEAAYAERMKEAFQISVEYGETGWDSLLEATITVTWPGAGNVGTAENVNVHIGVKDGLYISAGQEKVFLGNMTAGQSVTFGVNLGYDKAIEAEKRKEGKKPEPRFSVTVYASNTDYTRYTAVLDGMTEPRMMLLGADPELEDTIPIQNDLDMMKALFTDSWYNGQKFDLEKCMDPADFRDVLSKLNGMETDENDVTYIYLNAHGTAFKENGQQRLVSAFQMNFPDSFAVIDDKKYENKNVVRYELLLTYIEQYVKGRVVLLTDVCHSGRLINVAKDMGLSEERYSILTATNDISGAGLWGGEIEAVDVFDMTALSYGWFTNDMCNYIRIGDARDADGVTRMGKLSDIMTNPVSAALAQVSNALTGEKVAEGTDWKEYLAAFTLQLEQIEQLIKNGISDRTHQVLVQLSDYVDPWFFGNRDTLLHCSDPSYDDDQRRLVLIEEKLELLSPVELYYAYLREEVVPEIGVAAVNSEVRGDEGYDAAHWGRLNTTVGGLLSASVCDLDKNGTPDMLTIELNALPAEQISVSQRYFAADLKLYQIVDGEVLMNDVVEDVIWVNERNRTCSSQTNFRLTEYEGQLLIECWASFTDGLSYDGGMEGCYGFKDGFFTDPPARPGAYDFNYFTADGRAYSASRTTYEIGYQPDGSFRAVNGGEFIAHITYIPYFYPNHPGYVYYAGEINKIEEYLNEYEEEDYFVPLSYIGQPLPTAAPEAAAADAREAEVKAALEAAAAPYRERMEQARFRYSVSCKKDGDLSQIMISIGQTSAGAIDTGLLRELCAALVSADGAGLPEDAASMVGNFEFKKGKSKTAGLVEMAMNQKPSGEFVVTITNDRARK